MIRFNQNSFKDITIKDLQEETRQYKKEIKGLRQFRSLGLTNLQDQINKIVVNQGNLEEVPKSSQVNDEATDSYLNTVSKVIFQKWEVSLTIVIKDKFVLHTIALIELEASLNCLQEGLVPTQFYEKNKQVLSGANATRLMIDYKLSNAHICNQDICIKQTFILVRDLKEKVLHSITCSAYYFFTLPEQKVDPSIL